MSEFVSNLVNTYYEHARLVLQDNEYSNHANAPKFLGILANAQLIHIVYDWTNERGWPKD